MTSSGGSPCDSNGRAVFTVGYEGRNQQDILSLMSSHSISTVIDVRERPISRKPGFSKNHLMRFLQDNDLAYRSYRQLGSPKELREKVKTDGNLDYFFDHFREYLKTKRTFLNEVAELVNEGSICLICYEADPHSCHRYLVAERIGKIAKSRVIHL